MIKVLIAFAFLTTAVVAEAAPARRGAAFVPVAKCRDITDDAQRLACYDREVPAFARAVNDRQVAVVDRAEVTSAKRSLFGIALPNIKLFGGEDEELKQVESTVTAVQYNADGHLVFTVADNGTWVQTDDFALSTIKPGRKVTLKRAALGSFFAAFDKGPSVRAKRLR